MSLVARLAISIQARAICSPPSMGCRNVVARPPPSAIAVAPGPCRTEQVEADAAGDRRQPGAGGFDGLLLLPG